MHQLSNNINKDINNFQSTSWKYHLKCSESPIVINVIVENLTHEENLDFELKMLEIPRNIPVNILDEHYQTYQLKLNWNDQRLNLGHFSSRALSWRWPLEKWGQQSGWRDKHWMRVFYLCVAFPITFYT